MTRWFRFRFLWAMAWRETRGALRHFLFFLACIALGVGALVGVSGFSAMLDQAIRKEARALMAGDVEVRANRPLGDKETAALAALAARGVRLVAVSELVAMASHPSSGETVLVELKAVEPGYPFYGTLVVSPPEAVGVVSPPEAARALDDPFLALVDDGLLARLGLKVGEQIALGRTVLTIAGVIVKEPDRIAGAFSLGPRVLISQPALAATGLVQTGSRVRYRYLLKLPPSLEPAALVKELTPALSAMGAEVSVYDDAQPRLRRFLQNLTTYLGLVGLIALLVGGIGVANSVQAFMQEKMETLAVLKGLGADSPTLLRIYLLQTLLLAGVGSVAGAALGLGVQWLLPSMLSTLVPVQLEPVIVWWPILRGVAMGLLTALLFALWPLLGIRRIPPARIIRREVGGELFPTGGRLFGRRADRRAWTAAVAIGGGLVLLSLWQIGRVNLGATFLGVVAASLLLLWLAAQATMRVARSWPVSRRLAVRQACLPVRQGLANLHRPGSRTVTALISVGVGVTVTLAIVLVESSLLRQIHDNLPVDAPSFFFIDIQADQRGPFEQLLAARGVPAELTPIVRSRLHAVDGRSVADMTASGELEKRSDAWYFQREYVVTVQAGLPKGNRLVQGAWWSSDLMGDRMGGRTGAGASVSVEQEAAQHLGVRVGSTMTFDMQGRLVTATVASIREVNWGSLSTNFFVIFSPGALDGLPLTYLATARTPPSDDLALQRAVVAVFPNVTAINIRHVLDAIGAILERIAGVVRLMAGFTVTAGLLVLAGAIASTRYRRLREAVILKTLGATRLVIARIFAVEYAVLGAVAGVVGAALACLLSYILVRVFMELPWRPSPAALVIGIAGAVLLTVLTGFLATFRIIGQKPLAVLRQE